jgi:hypothetical protein
LSIYDSLQFSDSVILRFQKYKLLVSTCLICFKLLDPWSKTNLNISWTLTLMHVMTRTWPETVLLCYVVRFRQHLHLSLCVVFLSHADMHMRSKMLFQRGLVLMSNGSPSQCMECAYLWSLSLTVSFLWSFVILLFECLVNMCFVWVFFSLQPLIKTPVRYTKALF